MQNIFWKITKQFLSLRKKKTYKTHVLATYFTPSTWSDAEIAEVANTTLANVEMIRKEMTAQN